VFEEKYCEKYLCLRKRTENHNEELNGLYFLPIVWVIESSNVRGKYETDTKFWLVKPEGK
jgi:hypothetical protein